MQFKIQNFRIVLLSSLLVILFSVGLTSCVGMFMGKIDSKNTAEIKPAVISFVRSLGFNDDEMFFIDNKYVHTYLINLEKENKADTSCLLRDYAQIIYFDKNKEQISFCAASMSSLKFPYLITFKTKWNETGMYDTFPPTDYYNTPEYLKRTQQNQMTENNTPSNCRYIPYFDLDLDSIASYMMPLIPGNNIETIDTSYDYTVLIMAPATFLQKASKHQVKMVNENIELDSNRSRIKKYFIVSETLLQDWDEAIFNKATSSDSLQKP